MRTRLLAFFIAILGLLAGSIALAPAAGARTDNKTDRVLFVHGYSPFGTPTSTCDMWGNMKSTLTSLGFTGPKTTIGYYDNQVACDVSVIPYGSASKHYPPSGGVHDRYVEIEHLGYELAWTIYDRYSKSGQTVDVVAHSMGGLVVRYALAQVERKHPDFPPSLKVDDVMTLGTPHGGSGYASWCWTSQCGDMSYGSSFLSWLASYGANPQVGAGTDWTVVGSYDDGVISEASAVQMNAAHKVKYLGSSDIGHNDYYNSTSLSSTADVYWSDNGGPWYAWYDAHWPVEWASYSLWLGSW